MALEKDLVGIAITPEGDIEIDPAKGMRLVSGLEGVAANVDAITMLFKGEWFNDLELGIPYFEILGERYNADQVSAAFRKVLLAVPDVTKIDYFQGEYDRPKRVLHIRYRLVTAFGIIDRERDL